MSLLPRSRETRTSISPRRHVGLGALGSLHGDECGSQGWGCAADQRLRIALRHQQPKRLGVCLAADRPLQRFRVVRRNAHPERGRYRTGIWAYGIPNLGSGFKLTVPANTTVKTFKVYVGVYSGSGTFTAALSDNSARAFTNGPTSTLVNLSNGPGAVYTVTFAANSPGQVLTVTWTLKTVAGPGASQANVTLESAALSMSGANNPPSFPSPLRRRTISSLQASTSPSRRKLPTPTDRQPGGVLSGREQAWPGFLRAYTITWNNVPAGFHTLTATAADNQGQPQFRRLWKYSFTPVAGLWRAGAICRRRR